MAKIMIECADPDNFTAILEAAENASCSATYAEHHLRLVEAGKSKNQSESARIIAKDTGESSDAARMKIQRGLKEVEQVVQKQESPTKTDVCDDDENNYADDARAEERPLCDCGKPAKPSGTDSLGKKRYCKKCWKCLAAQSKAKKEKKNSPSGAQQNSASPSTHSILNHTEAFRWSGTAISQLSRIQNDDPNAEAALNEVIEWCVARINQIKEG